MLVANLPEQELALRLSSYLCRRPFPFSPCRRSFRAPSLNPMRTVSLPVLQYSRCISRSPPRASTRPLHPLDPLYRRGTRSQATAAGPEWHLEDLARVSEGTTPLIFHLTSDDPYQNLSIEHYLLTRSHPNSRILLFYTNRPCVVIGRNQNPWLETDLKRLQEGLWPERQTVATETSADRQGSPTGTLARGEKDAERGQPVDLVRRRSGGGTVFHDSGNLNYSVIIPNTKSFKRSTHAEMVVRALSRLSTSTSLHFDFDGHVRVNDRNDIVMRRRNDSQWLKVSGSAFKLTRGRALHHGTLLYSSPYIDRISDLLRSPGRDLIQAKGVESVRSKVGNLSWTPNVQGREEARREITEAIMREFWDMYADDQTRTPGLNEVTLGSAEDGAAASNGEIAAGMEELMSDAWRFEQTPRFDFTSGVLDGAEITFHANHGVLEHLTLRTGSGDDVLQMNKDDFDAPVKLHKVKQWGDVLRPRGDAPTSSKDISMPETLIKRVEAIFPRSRPELEGEIQIPTGTHEPV